LHISRTIAESKTPIHEGACKLVELDAAGLRIAGWAASLRDELGDESENADTATEVGENVLG